MTGPLDQLLNHFEEEASSARFEEQYGKQAAGFLGPLSSLYRLYRRLPYDFEVSLETRRLAASVALYVAENTDFLDDAGRAGLIDDVWITYAALERVVEGAGDEVIRRHWRSETAFDDVLGLAANVDTLREHVPSKVFERITAYLGGE